jgi:hypothetical protein
VSGLGSMRTHGEAVGRGEAVHRKGFSAKTHSRAVWADGPAQGHYRRAAEMMVKLEGPEGVHLCELLTRWAAVRPSVGPRALYAAPRPIHHGQSPSQPCITSQGPSFTVRDLS